MSLSVCQLCAVDFTVKHFLTGLMDRIGEKGWNVRVVGSDGELVPELRERGYKVANPPISCGLNPLAHAISLFRLAALFRRERFDILHMRTPVDAARRRIRYDLGIRVDTIAIGMVGRMVAENGFPELLAAARRIALAHPGVYFVDIGDRLASDHAEGFDAELALTRSALGARLVLTGLRSDIPGLLTALDVFTLPSHREGMPITIIEAMMMMALPVVATDIRGSREEVVEGETGLLVPVRDAAALAAALQTLVDDPEARTHMGRAGRARALALFDESRVVARQIAEIRARLPAGLRERA
jgi:glycosyltransferase involved in cell wall biosynthesis